MKPPTLADWLFTKLAPRQVLGTLAQYRVARGSRKALGGPRQRRDPKVALAAE